MIDSAWPPTLKTERFDSYSPKLGAAMLVFNSPWYLLLLLLLPAMWWFSFHSLSGLGALAAAVGARPADARDAAARGGARRNAVSADERSAHRHLLARSIAEHSRSAPGGDDQLRECVDPRAARGGEETTRPA